MSNKALLNSVFKRLLEQITPQKLIAEQCELTADTLRVGQSVYELSGYKKIYLLGSGKAVIPMAKTLQTMLKERISHTLIVGPYLLNEALEKTRYLQSSHPLPSEQSLLAAKALQEELRSFEPDDLFIYLLSGGSSSLLELPEAPISLEEFQEATRLMLRGGMAIDEINCVRKHLSAIKGGKLALLTQARGIVLVLSDVIGDDLHTIGSAPLYYDKTRFEEAIEMLENASLFEQMPPRIQRFLIEGEEGMNDETPKEEQAHISHHIIGSNRVVLHKAQALLEESGVETSLIEKPMQGEVSDLARELYILARVPLQKRHCYIFGGEATVTLKAEGRGGRNQHLCLSLLSLLEKEINLTFLSAATDGIDGNSKAAGALIDGHSRANAQARHLDIKYYLDNFDSYAFFLHSKELLITGPTHNNLLDISMLLIEPKTGEGDKNV
jgi:glycerate-2-kinase